MAAGRSNLFFAVFLGLAGLTALAVSLCFLLPQRTRFELAQGRETENAATAPAMRPPQETESRTAPLSSRVTPASATAAPKAAPSRVDQVRAALADGRLDAAPNQVSDEEGAAIVRRIAEGLASAGDLARLARTLADDPRMSDLLRPMAEEWKSSTDPETRARGLLFLAALDAANTTGLWQAALDGERDERVRTALLEGAPLSGRPETDAPVVEALLSVAARDGSEAVRGAAVRGLPAEMGAEPVRKLAAAFGRERAQGVRLEMLRVLGRLRSDDPKVIETLEATAFQEGEDLEIRREAFGALIRADNEHPGLLSEEKLARVEETLGRLGRTP